MWSSANYFTYLSLSIWEAGSSAIPSEEPSLPTPNIQLIHSLPPLESSWLPGLSSSLWRIAVRTEVIYVKYSTLAQSSCSINKHSYSYYHLLVVYFVSHRSHQSYLIHKTHTVTFICIHLCIKYLTNTFQMPGTVLETRAKAEKKKSPELCPHGQ